MGPHLRGDDSGWFGGQHQLRKVSQALMFHLERDTR
jgi:hypothetical protein